jgi:hypothetical protein
MQALPETVRFGLRLPVAQTDNPNTTIKQLNFHFMPATLSKPAPGARHFE